MFFSVAPACGESPLQCEFREEIGRTHPAKDEDERPVPLARDGAAQPLHLLGGRGGGVPGEGALEVSEQLVVVVLDLQLAEPVGGGVSGDEGRHGLALAVEARRGRPDRAYHRCGHPRSRSDVVSWSLRFSPLPFALDFFMQNTFHSQSASFVLVCTLPVPAGDFLPTFTIRQTATFPNYFVP